MNLCDLKIGEQAIVTAVGGHGELRQHFLDMGVIPGAEMTLVKFAPMGDPMEFRIHSYELTLRMAEAKEIEIRKTGAEAVSETGAETVSKTGAKTGAEAEARGTDKTKRSSKKRTRLEHPGLGEGGRYHVKADENPLPKGKTVTFALVGNQNCGKTTLFNQLTGANQHVGNFPGVTVDRKDGSIKGHPDTLVTDLPGIYSMSPYTPEEIVTREFVLNEKPDGIINIVDATNIERNLYLTMQLMELDIPMVLALNMMDEVRENGGSIDINALEGALGIPVIPISAAKNEGISELIDHAMHVAMFQERPGRQDFCDENHEGGAVHRGLHAIMHSIEDHAEAEGIPLRFAASKVAENDELILNALKLQQNEKELIEHIVIQMEDERKLDRAAAIADMRFSFIMKICNAAVIHPKASKSREISLKIDRVLTGKWTAVPCFILIIGLMFYLTFHVLGAALQELLAGGISALSDLADQGLTAIGVAPWLHSLIIDGIFTGVGSVLSFLPIIIILFLFLSLLEDSGYLARVAFVMDKPLRRLGLSGRSIVPMLVGFGCTVTGVMSARTLPSERDRKMTILMTPFMSCSAKLPIYAFFATAFFPAYAGLVMVGIYLFDILIGILMSAVYRKTVFKGDPVPFVMELPNYRFPGLKNVLQLLWEKAKDFLTRAFTVILLASIIIWFLQTYDFRLNMVTDSGASILAQISGFLAPVFAPVGFSDWRVVTAFFSGFLAKESMVSTLQVLIGSEAALSAVLKPAAALALIVFSSLYTPCVAAVAAVRRELGRKWALWVVFGQCAIAWLISFLVYLIAGLF